MTSAAIDDVVGARFNGHASLSTLASKITLAALPRALSSLPMSDIIFTFRRLRAGRSFTTSSVSPEFDINIMTSF